MTNPYDPPVTEFAPPANAKNRSFFIGGFSLVTFLALVIGAGVGVLITSVDTIGSAVWGVPALGWFVALAVLVSIIRNSRFSTKRGLLVALGLGFPAYILYVPVCTVSSMLTQVWIPSKDYGPAPTGVILGSAFAFLVILLSIAAILRVYYRVPDRLNAPIPDKAIDQQPDNEFL